jgi:hypothetical protein
MPIPAFDHLGVLPPFLGRAHELHARSPYSASMEELATAFGHSVERNAILRGLIAFRSALRAELDLADAIQWIDGSFVEDVERSEGRPPRDVDVLTVGRFPALSVLTPAQRKLLHPAETKHRFRCDAYVLDLSAKSAEYVTTRVAYWHGLFAHRRDGTWKGIVALRLDAGDDERALARLGAA